MQIRSDPIEKSASGAEIAILLGMAEQLSENGYLFLQVFQIVEHLKQDELRKQGTRVSGFSQCYILHPLIILGFSF